MTPLGWLGLGGVCGVLALPSPVGGRTAVLADAGRLAVRAGPDRRWSRWAGVGPKCAVVVGAFTTVLLAWRVGPVLTVGAVAVVGVTAVLGRDAVLARRHAARQVALVTAVRLLAAELVAGTTPDAALDAAAATSPAAADLRAVPGSDLPGGADPALRALAVAWSLAASTGAALADVVERVATDIAARDARRRAVAIAVAGPRASAVMLSVLPAVGLVLGAAMGARPLEFLLGDGGGQVVCAAGSVLDAAGVLWVRRIIRRVQ